ncbi:MAG: hypothetical protein LBC13_01415 [Clostridiales bacterium]|jgi:hypothetical protein|nr:hypothetical protein [Clostridiales bacterium]
METVWDGIKNAFKSKAKLEEERQSKLADAAEKEKAVTKRLRELEKEYEDSLPENGKSNLTEFFPESLGLAKLDENGKSDDEIEYTAKGEYELKKQSDMLTASNGYAGKIQKQEEKKAGLYDDYQRKAAEIENAFKEAAEKSKNRAMDRGIARSSILAAGTKELARERDAESSLNSAEYGLKSDSVSAEINRLEGALDTALQSLDLDYASKIAKRISALQKERETARNNAVKYNNTVGEKENDYLTKRAENMEGYLSELSENDLKERAALTEYESKYGYDAAKQQNYASRFAAARDFYLSLSDDIAADALAASPDMKHYLGIYYQPLMSLLERRTSQTKSKTVY